ncbi:MAG: hypothetical protein ACTSQ4_12175, partial [Candidatus Heimdallarchaeaceae archaeon]
MSISFIPLEWELNIMALDEWLTDVTQLSDPFHPKFLDPVFENLFLLTLKSPPSEIDYPFVLDIILCIEKLLTILEKYQENEFYILRRRAEIRYGYAMFSSKFDVEMNLIELLKKSEEEFNFLLQERGIVFLVHVLTV